MDKHTTASVIQSAIVVRIPFFYGWIILGVSALAWFMSGPGQTYSISIFVDPIISELGYSRTFVSILYTAGSITAGVVVILVGRLLDLYGARIMLGSVCILFGLSALWMSYVDHSIKLYIGFAALRTLGQGSLMLIPSTLIAWWFIRLRGRAMAFGSVGMAVSQAVFPIMMHLLVNHIGWRSAWIVLAFIIWIVLFPMIFFIFDKPESVGLLPDGLSSQTEGKIEDGKTSVELGVDFSLKEALRTSAFWLLLFAGSSMPLIMTGLIFHQVSLLTGKGITAAVAASVFSIIGPMHLVGNFFAGFMADKFPNRYLMAGGQGILAISMLLTFNISSSWQAFLYGAILGLSGGFIANIVAVIWPNYYGRSHLGSIRGITTSSMVFFAALGPLPFGWIFDLTGSYSYVILVLLLLPISCALAALLAYPPRKPPQKENSN